MGTELFGLAAAITLSFSAILIRHGLSKHPYTFSNIWWSLTGVSAVWLIVLLLQFSLPTKESLPIFALRGILEPGLASILLFTAFRKLGVSVVIPIIAASPLVATAISVFWLGEILTVPIILGTLFIIAGVVFISRNHEVAKVNPKYVVMAVAGSTCIGVAAPITRFGLLQSNTPLSGLAVSLTAAFFTILFAILLTRKWNTIPRTFEKIRWFILASLLSTTGFLFLFLALTDAPVSIVQPLSSTQPLFALFISWIFLKKEEHITKEIVIGTIAVVAGAVFLTAL